MNLLQHLKMAIMLARGNPMTLEAGTADAEMTVRIDPQEFASFVDVVERARRAQAAIVEMTEQLEDDEVESLQERIQSALQIGNALLEQDNDAHR
jgi:hypothetical protein